MDVIAAATAALVAAGATRGPDDRGGSMAMDVDAGAGAAAASPPATDTAADAGDGADVADSDGDSGSDVDIGSDGEPVPATVAHALRLLAAPTACTHWEVIIEGPDALDAVIAALRRRAHPREVALAAALADVPAAACA